MPMCTKSFTKHCDVMLIALLFDFGHYDCCKRLPTSLATPKASLRSNDSKFWFLTTHRGASGKISNEGFGVIYSGIQIPCIVRGVIAGRDLNDGITWITFNLFLIKSIENEK
jgi:hypothetical protein